MAVPKQRMGRIRTHQRRSMHDRIDAPSRSELWLLQEPRDYRNRIKRYREIV